MAMEDVLVLTGRSEKMPDIANRTCSRPQDATRALPTLWSIAGAAGQLFGSNSQIDKHCAMGEFWLLRHHHTVKDAKKRAFANSDSILCFGKGKQTGASQQYRKSFDYYTASWQNETSKYLSQEMSVKPGCKLPEITIRLARKV